MAQQMIDIIGMLRDKTRGNLDHDEQALLEAILFDLRMKYVEIADADTAIRLGPVDQRANVLRSF